MSEDFEERLKVLRSHLENERLKQVNTMKGVLERQQTTDFEEIEKKHLEDLHEIRDGMYLNAVRFAMYSILRNYIIFYYNYKHELLLQIILNLGCFNMSLFPPS